MRRVPPRPTIILALLASFGAAASLGCNTVAGAGEDLQQASANVREAISSSNDPEPDDGVGRAEPRRDTRPPTYVEPN